MISVELVKEDDALENLVAARSGFPSELRSQVHRSQSSSGAVNVTAAANLLALKASVLSEGMNLSRLFADRRETWLTTSTVFNVACGGTFTSIENSDEDITAPFTGPNHTSRFPAIALNPLPVMTIVSLGAAVKGSTF
jgi:hypothetical protein